MLLPSLAFLLNNGIAYHLANGIAVTEFLVTQYFFPNFKTYPWVSQVGESAVPCQACPSPRRSIHRATCLRLGIVMTLISHALRSGSMIHAATNFSHAVMFKKEETHVLVTDGIYS